MPGLRPHPPFQAVALASQVCRFLLIATKHRTCPSSMSCLAAMSMCSSTALPQEKPRRHHLAQHQLP